MYTWVCDWINLGEFPGVLRSLPRFGNCFPLRALMDLQRKCYGVRERVLSRRGLMPPECRSSPSSPDSNLDNGKQTDTKLSLFSRFFWRKAQEGGRDLRLKFIDLVFQSVFSIILRYEK